MSAPFPASVILHAEKGAPLTAPEVDSNFPNLVDALQALASQGVAGLGLLEFDPDTGVVRVLSTTNRVVGSFQLPSRPVCPRGTWTASLPYVQGDLVRIEPSATVPRGFIAFVPTSYTSDATDPANDIAKGALLALAYDGKPAQTNRGTYSALVTYAVGDVVHVASGERYQLFDPAPAGSTPGAPILDANGSPILKGGQLQFPWAQLSVSSIEPFAFAVVGKPAVNALLVRRMVSRVGFIGPNQSGSTSFNGSQAKCTTAPTAAVTLTLAQNGTTIGTIAFAAGSKLGVCTTTGGNAYYLVPGDVLTLTSSATQDATFSDPIGFIALH